MNPKLYFATAVLLVQISMFAQSKPKLRFVSINNAGLLAGASTNAFQLQTINGLSYKTFSAAVGVGIDKYYMKSFPLFIDLRKNIVDKKETPFLYADLGANLPGQKTKEEGLGKSTFSNGLYYDFGIGYSWTLTGKLGLNFSAGYSQKNIKEASIYQYVIWSPDRNSEDSYYKYNYNYSFRRLSIKAGLSF